MDPTEPTSLSVELLPGFFPGTHCSLGLLESSQSFLRAVQDPVRSLSGLLICVVPQPWGWWLCREDHPARQGGPSCPSRSVVESQTLRLLLTTSLLLVRKKGMGPRCEARPISAMSSAISGSPQARPASSGCPHPLLRSGEEDSAESQTLQVDGLLIGLLMAFAG